LKKLFLFPIIVFWLGRFFIWTVVVVVVVSGF
jgi:hypothetical protein